MAITVETNELALGVSDSAIMNDTLAKSVF